MATLWKTTKRAGVVIGPLVFIGSVALAARDVAEWGLQWYWWAVIGGGIFFTSGFAIIWGQQKEISKLQKRLDGAASTNWIDAYKARFGVLPQVPKSFLPLVDNYIDGEPISKKIKWKTNLQYWRGLTGDNRERFFQLIDWLGGDRYDYLQHMLDTAPPSGSAITQLHRKRKGE